MGDDRYVTAPTKVPKDLKEEAERLGIRDPEILRKALEREVKARKLEEVKRKVNELHEALEKIDVEEFVKLIREDREKR